MTKQALTKDEEYMLFEEYSKTKDIGLRDEIFLKNKGLVQKNVCKLIGLCVNLDYDDLLQEGFIALLDIISKFDHTKKIKFSSYAYKSIKRRLLRIIHNNEDLVRKPVYLHKKENKESKEFSECFLKPTSLDDSFLEHNITEENNFQDYNALNRAIITVLSEKEKTILNYMYGLNSYALLTCNQIGKLPQFGCSGARISFLHTKAKKKLHDYMIGTSEPINSVPVEQEQEKKRPIKEYKKQLLGFSEESNIAFINIGSGNIFIVLKDGTQKKVFTTQEVRQALHYKMHNFFEGLI